MRMNLIPAMSCLSMGHSHRYQGQKHFPQVPVATPQGFLIGGVSVWVGVGSKVPEGSLAWGLLIKWGALWMGEGVTHCTPRQSWLAASIAPPQGKSTTVPTTPDVRHRAHSLDRPQVHSIMPGFSSRDPSLTEPLMHCIDVLVLKIPTVRLFFGQEPEEFNEGVCDIETMADQI